MKLRTDYAHVGLYDVLHDRLWIAKKRFGVVPIRTRHEQLLAAGAERGPAGRDGKDRFVRYRFYTPASGSGFVQGYPIDWKEGHLLVDLQPEWDHATHREARPADAAKIRRNIEQQYCWGYKILDAYVAMRIHFPLCLHIIGRRATESGFYVRRVESKRVKSFSK